jgi:hypothetical protein
VALRMAADSKSEARSRLSGCSDPRGEGNGAEAIGAPEGAGSLYTFEGICIGMYGFLCILASARLETPNDSSSCPRHPVRVAGRPPLATTEHKPRPANEYPLRVLLAEDNWSTSAWLGGCSADGLPDRDRGDPGDLGWRYLCF